MEDQDDEKVFSLPEIIILLLFVFLGDFFDVFALLSNTVPLLGQILFLIAKFASFILWAAVQLYMLFKGVRGLYQFIFGIGSILDIVIPFQTIALAATIFLANHPNIIPGGEETLSVASGIKGGAPQKTASKIRPHPFFYNVRPSSPQGKPPEETENGSEIPYDKPLPSADASREKDFGMPADTEEQLKRELFEEIPKKNPIQINDAQNNVLDLKNRP